MRVLSSLAMTAALLLGTSMANAQRAGPPTFENSMAQRALACTHCHGSQGRAAPDGYYPRIAGKPAGYIYNQLLNFRDERRHYGPMTQLLATLSDDYLMAIATHFSSLQVPYPAPVGSAAPAAVLERGRQLVQQGDASRQVPACAQCHGQRMTGVLPNVPGLLGLPRDYLNAQLGAWRSGKRRAHAPDCMADIAKALQPQDIESVAHWLAAQPVPVDSKPVAPNSSRDGLKPGSVPTCGTADRMAARP